MSINLTVSATGSCEPFHSKIHKKSALFSSASVEHATPQPVFDALHSLFNFDMDPCCTHQNAKCETHYTIAEDGLSRSWAHRRVWLNPPYGKTIHAWMAKALHSAECCGATVVCLVPARTDTAWWHETVLKSRNCQIVFLRGRLKFGAAKNSAPFPSVLIVFRPPGAKQLPKNEIYNALLNARPTPVQKR